VPEITKDHSNQPRSFMLFGKVIFQAPSLEVKHTSIQTNQNHGWSRDMTSTTAAYDQSYPSGTWSNWSGVSTDSYHHQSWFSNLMPYGLVNVLQLGRSWKKCICQLEASAILCEHDTSQYDERWSSQSYGASK
jgi:hypothetical protein